MSCQKKVSENLLNRVQLNQFMLTEVTLAAVKKQIADQEHAKSMSDDRHVVGSSGSDFILSGMDIQQQQ
jgi:hypothetical protein